MDNKKTMKEPKTRNAKIKLADSTLNISEKLFLAPYIALVGAFFSFDNTVSMFIPIILSFAILAMAIIFRQYAMELYDKAYEDDAEI